MDEEIEIIEMELRLKKLKKQLREKNKPKTITIPGKDHAKIKAYCQIFNLNIGEWASKVLIKEVDQNNCITIDTRSREEIEKEKCEVIMDKYINDNLLKCVSKTEYLIMSPFFKFVGISIEDSKNIYEYVGSEKEKMISKLKESNIEVYDVFRGEIFRKDLQVDRASEKMVIIDENMNINFI